MIKLLLILAFNVIVYFSYGQYRHHLISDSSAYKNNRYVIFLTDNQQPTKAYDYIIDYTSFNSPIKDTAGKYSNKKDNALIYKANPTIHLLNVSQLLKAFHISTKYYDLPIYIDSILVYPKENAFFQLSYVPWVKIQKEKKTHLKYINIHSKHHTSIYNGIFDCYFCDGLYLKKD